MASSDEEDEFYEYVQNVTSINNDDKATLSNVHKTRLFDDISKTGLRGSLVAFKEGVPGLYSGYKLGRRKSRPKSVPVINDESLPTKPLKSHKLSNTRKILIRSESATVVSHRRVGDEEEGTLESCKPYSNCVDSGVDNYDTLDESIYDKTDVVLPPTYYDNAEDSSDEGWGSEFEEPLDEEDGEIYDIIGEPREKSDTIDSNYEHIDFKLSRRHRKPPLPPRRSVIFDSLEESDLDKETYIPVAIDSEEEPAQLPPIKQGADDAELKRYQIIQCILETEKSYMKCLKKLVTEFEQPLYDNKIIGPDRVKVMFKHIHEIIQCHQLFNMALCDRVKEWNHTQLIGDVIFASFSKSMALKAYSSFVSHFSNAMDSIKETCKLVPSFLTFLKYRLYRHNKESLYDLMQQPLERIPQLAILVQLLLKVTELPHPDHLPLQMALTHLECLSETLADKKRDAVMAYKVRYLDSHCLGLTKSLASKKRYYVRHDDMIQCIVENGNVVKVKLRRLFMLSDLLVCTSKLHKQEQLKLLTKKRYKVKWCIPVNDVDVIELGQGVFVSIDQSKTTTIKYSNLVSSSRPDLVNKRIDDIQHDLAIIGQISALVSSLRKSYKFTDVSQINNWYKDVHDLLNRETHCANLHWLELSIPSQTTKTKCDRVCYLFNIHSPMLKLQWLAQLNNVKLRLAFDNNPGWYLQEESISKGETAILRRTLPLVTHKLPLFTVAQNFSVDFVLEITTMNGTPMMWVFSGTQHVGIVTVIEMDVQRVPHVTESFVACDSRVCCAELVSQNDTVVHVWLGTQAGRIVLYEPNKVTKIPQDAKLKDSVVSLKSCNGKVFAGLANGALLCFRKMLCGEWDLGNPTTIYLGKHTVLSMTETQEMLWCTCGSQIHIMDTETFSLKKKIDICENDKSVVKNLATCGMGVWMSVWKSSRLQLYHVETHEQLQTINITTALTRMKNDIEVIQSLNLDSVHVTCLLASEGLLWVGTDAGLIITYPLPRLGGIPTVSGQACVSFHAHRGPVKHINTFKVPEQLIRKDTSKNDEIREPLLVLNEDEEEGEPLYYTVESDLVKQGIEHEENKSVGDKEVDDATSKEDGYEMPLEGSSLYAPIRKEPFTDLDEIYRALPLPKQPCDNDRESVYMPLLTDSLSSSVTSMIGLKAYDREVSLTPSETSQSHYASLTSFTKREDMSRKECLLNPSYVVSIGKGHIDLRRADDISKPASPEIESRLFIWKLT